MTPSKFARFVHQVSPTLFVVAEYCARTGQYTWPANREAARTGALASFGPIEHGDWRYDSRPKALAAARRFYGERVAFEADAEPLDAHTLAIVDAELRAALEREEARIEGEAL